MKKLGLLLVVALFVSCTASAGIEPVRVLNLGGAAPHLMAFSAERNMIAAVDGYDRRFINIFDNVGRQVNRIYADGPVTNLALSPSFMGHMMLAVTTANETVMLFDVPSGRRLPCNVHPVRATAIAFSPHIAEGMILAIATQDDEIVAYNVLTHQVVGVWDCEHADLLAFSQEVQNREVRFVIAARGKKFAYVYSVEGGRFIRRLDIGSPIIDLAFYPHPHLNDFILAVVVDNARRPHGYGYGCMPMYDYGHGGGYGCMPMYGYACVPMHGYGHVMGHNCSVQLWDVEREIHLRSHPLPGEVLTGRLTFAPLCSEGLFFAALTRYDDARVYHLADMVPEHEYRHHGCAPMHGYGCALMYGYGCMPVYGYGCAPVYGYGCMPVYGYGCAPVYGYGCAPVYGYGCPPPIQYYGNYGCPGFW